MIRRFDVGPRLSEMAVSRGLVFLAGQVPDDPEGDITAQTREVLASIDALLDRAGSNRSKILMATIYLRDMADFAGMNAVWDRWVVAQHTPPRATVQAALADPRWRIEVVVTAMV